MTRDEIIELMVRAHDREQAAQMGEPDPWLSPDPIAEAESRACMAAALDAADAAGWVMIEPYGKVTITGDAESTEYQMVPTRTIKMYQDAIRILKGEGP